jgi:hypothetical protein
VASSAALILIGHLWLLLLPVEHLGEPTKIDEHALQVGQVRTSYLVNAHRDLKVDHHVSYGAIFEQASTYVGWDSVHAADRYLDGLKDLLARNATNIEYVAIPFLYASHDLLPSLQSFTHASLVFPFPPAGSPPTCPSSSPSSASSPRLKPTQPLPPSVPTPEPTSGPLSFRPEQAGRKPSSWPPVGRVSRSRESSSRANLEDLGERECST